MLRRTVTTLALVVSACGTPMQPAPDGSSALDGASGADGAIDDREGADQRAPAEDGGANGTDSSATDAMDASTDDTGVSPPADAGTGMVDFAAMGPLSISAASFNNVMLPTSTGCAGNDCRVNVFVTMPTNSAPGRTAPFPVAVISNGFIISASQYQSYAARLARWGYVVLRWDTTTEGGVIPRSIAHRVLGNMLRALPDTVAAMGTMGANMDTRRVVFAGHSRGGKLSALAASGNSNAVAFVGLDPVDATPPGTPAGPDYPSGAAALASFTGSSLVIGAALSSMTMFGMACAPTATNYQTFYSMARAPAFETTLAQTGHVQFVDMRPSCGTACSLCVNGTTPDASVSALSGVLLVAASERATRGADASAYLSPSGSWISAQSIATMSRGR